MNKIDVTEDLLYMLDNKYPDSFNILLENDYLFEVTKLVFKSENLKQNIIEEMDDLLGKNENEIKQGLEDIILLIKDNIENEPKEKEKEIYYL